MAVKLGGLRLWNVQEDMLEVRTNTQVDSVYGQNSSEALLTSLEKNNTFEFTGRVPATRLALQPGYSDDYETALAEWVAELETFMNGEQGGGWTLTDDERDNTINVLLDEIGWGHSQGEKYEITYNASAKWAEGLTTSTSTAADSVSPTDTWEIYDPETSTTLDLGSLRDYRVQKTQEVKEYPIAFQDAGDNTAMQQSGVTRRITISGQKTGTRSERNTFDSNMNDLMGKDKTVEYTEHLTGRTFKVTVEDYRTPRASGKVRINDYDLTLVEGITLT